MQQRSKRFSSPSLLQEYEDRSERPETNFLAQKFNAKELELNRRDADDDGDTLEPVHTKEHRWPEQSSSHDRPSGREENHLLQRKNLAQSAAEEIPDMTVIEDPMDYRI